ncbi:PEP/pyruvate-binding domain-containing protein [Modestobacter sp. URMC 112]
MKATVSPRPKGGNLSLLARRSTDYVIPTFIAIEWREWRRLRDSILETVLSRLEPSTVVAVRSNSDDEDASTSTNAGRYKTILNVLLARDPVAQAIDEVMADIRLKTGRESAAGVIVQAMVTNGTMSGVVSTVDTRTGAPYLVFDYIRSADTAAVTSGIVATSRLYVRRAIKSSFIPSDVRNICRAVERIGKDLGGEPVQVEFTLDAKGTLYVLQGRHLSAHNAASPSENRTSLATAVRTVRRLLRSGTLLSDTADWNPAEMIGEEPHELAYSLYRTFLTRNTWRRARSELGYYTPPIADLMYRIGARPMIDIRSSLESLTPAGATESLRNAIVLRGLELVREDVTRHKWVEFEASTPSASLDTPNHVARLYSDAISSDGRRELVERLRTLTKALIEDHSSPSSTQSLHSSLDQHLARLNELPSARRVTTSVRAGRPLALAFALAARHAFVAEQFIRDLLMFDILTQERVALLRQSITTVATEMTIDASRVRGGQLDESDFLSTWGHLRPGTYDIRSLTYRDRDLTSLFDASHPAEPNAFQFTGTERESINRALRREGLTVEVEALHAYICSAIRLREYGKHVYSKFLSGLMEDIAVWGARLNLSRDDMGHLSLGQLSAFQGKERLTDIVVAEAVQRGRRGDRIRRLTRTPSVLSGALELYVVAPTDERPHFVGSGVARGPVRFIGEGIEIGSVAGAVICTERADPGYDWLLTLGIAGIITRFGGSNSHLAVRCAELDIPAAIGVSETTFESMRCTYEVEIDCSGGAIRRGTPIR